jgi:hypothetical protein
MNRLFVVPQRTKKASGERLHRVREALMKPKPENPRNDSLFVKEGKIGLGTANDRRLDESEIAQITYVVLLTQLVIESLGS